MLLIKWVTRSDKINMYLILIDGHGKTVIFSPKQKEFVCIVGALEVSPLPRYQLMEWYYNFFKRGSYHCSSHHGKNHKITWLESKSQSNLVMCCDDSCGDHCLVFKIYNITPFKNAAKDSLPMPRQYKQINFVLGKIIHTQNIIHMNNLYTIHNT